MLPYKHVVKYYETDKMGITHHSNYIRIMEEARIDFLDQIGYSFKRMENEGLVCPTISASAEYKKPTTFNDEIEVVVKLTEITPVRSFWKYEMTCNGQIVCIGTSSHCFIDNNGRPVSTKKASPEIYELLLSLVEK